MVPSAVTATRGAAIFMYSPANARSQRPIRRSRKRLKWIGNTTPLDA